MNRYIEYCSVSHRSTNPVNGTISKLFNVVQIIYVIIFNHDNICANNEKIT